MVGFLRAFVGFCWASGELLVVFWWALSRLWVGLVGIWWAYGTLLVGFVVRLWWDFPGLLVAFW
jgi:hypothetical protein